MKNIKENLQNEIRNAVKGSSNWVGSSSPEDAVKKLFKEKMIAVIENVSESLDKRDSGYSRTVKTLMEMAKEIKGI